MDSDVIPVLRKYSKGLATPEKVLGRTVLEWHSYGGTYGMGGPGFLCFHLAAGLDRPAEWLILTLWGGDNWVTANDRWIGCHSNQYSVQRPWHGFQEVGWDDLSPLLIGKQLTAFELQPRSFKMTIGDVVLALSEDPATRPLYGGSGQPHLLKPDTDLRLAWILADTSGVVI